MEIGKLYKTQYQILSLYYVHSFSPGTILMILKNGVFKTEQKFGTIYQTQILVGHKTFEMFHYNKNYISLNSILLE
jgi:hypothetical protein